jgi:hypothetical protein
VPETRYFSYDMGIRSNFVPRRDQPPVPEPSFAERFDGLVRYEILIVLTNIAIRYLLEQNDSPVFSSRTRVASYGVKRTTHRR